MTLHLETRGAGPPVLLIHGFGATLETWSPVAGRLARSHRLLLVDLKGHGASPAPRDARYSPLDHAEAVRATVDRADPGPLSVVGHSLGGAVALLLALAAARDGGPAVERLVLISSAAYRQRLPPYIAFARLPLLPRLFFRLVPGRWIARGALRRAVHDPETVREAAVEAYGRSLDSPGGRYATIQGARQIFPPNVERLVSRYGEIDVPTGLVWGRHDPVVPLALGERLRDDIPGARLEVMEECGHVPHEERPGEAARLILGFLGAREPFTP